MKDLGRRTTELAYGSNDNVPDVFVYLRYKDDNICYFRVPFEKINIIDKTSRWYDFTPDKSLNIVKNEWEAGFLKIRLYLGRLDAGYGVNDFDWGRDPEIK